MRRPSGVWRSRTPAAAHERLRPGGCIPGLLRGRPQQPRRRHRLQLRCVFLNTHSARAWFASSQVLARALPCASHAANLMGRRGRCDSTPGGQAPSRGSPRACLMVDGSADRDVMGLFGPPRLGARLRARPVVKWLPRPGEGRRSHPVVRRMATSLVASAGAVVRWYMRWAMGWPVPGDDGGRRGGWPVPVADGGRRGGTEPVDDPRRV